jgi:hypothetical protein
LNEGWIVFEESTSTNVKPLKLAKRTTLTSYSNSGRRLSVEIPPGREGALPSAPLRQTPSGELVKNLPDRRDPPSSARIEAKKGTKSFLRPFLLGGRRKKGEMPAAAMHKSKREEEFEVHAIEKMVDEHLQVEFDTPESPRETTASTPQHNSDGDDDGSGEPSPVWAPLGKGKKGVSRRVAEMRVEGSVPASPGVVTPITAKIPLTPVTPSTPVSPPIVNSSTPSPVPTPITAFIELTPVEASIPFTPVPITPITPSPATTTPPSPIISTPSSPIPNTPTTTSTPSAHRERGHERGRDHHHRNPDETSDERRNRKEREHARRKEGFEGEQRARSSRSEKVEKEDTWLEVVFEDLPFGPDRNMVSPPFFSSIVTPRPYAVLAL